MKKKYVIATALITLSSAPVALAQSNMPGEYPAYAGTAPQFDAEAPIIAEGVLPEQPPFPSGVTTAPAEPSPPGPYAPPGLRFPTPQIAGPGYVWAFVQCPTCPPQYGTWYLIPDPNPPMYDMQPPVPAPPIAVPTVPYMLQIPPAPAFSPPYRNPADPREPLGPDEPFA